MKAFLLVGWCVAWVLVVANAAPNELKYIGEGTSKVPTKLVYPEQLKVGHLIHVVGTVKENPKRIFVDFHKGKDFSESEIPVHVSARWDEGIFSGKIVYNTKLNNAWAEREQRLKNPFKAKEEMDLRIRVIDGKFQIFGNRKYMGDFQQRQAIDGILSMTVGGDLENLRYAAYEGQQFTVPHESVCDLTPGKRLDVAIYPKGNRVDVELYSKDRKDIPLQLSIRFKEKVVVRNAKINNSWGKEEREGSLPIPKDKVFDLSIVNEQYSYQIYFNQKRFATFAHRTDPKSVKYVKVDGDCDLHSIVTHDKIE